jgi:multiple sugar transport system substrate-binding protein
VGAGNFIGQHAMVMMMINNGGGLFNSANQLDIVTPANLQAMEFVQELAKAKIIDPGAVSYTTNTLNEQWKSGKIAMGINTGDLPVGAGITDGSVAPMPSPLTAPNGQKACLVFQNNIMMYKNTPSQAGSEAFLAFYIKNMSSYWKQGLLSGLPVLKSIIALPEFQQQTDLVAAVNDWQPYSKNYASTGTVLSPSLAKVDGSNQLTNFVQTMIEGGNPKTALQTLDSSLAPLFA